MRSSLRTSSNRWADARDHFEWTRPGPIWVERSLGVPKKAWTGFCLLLPEVKEEKLSVLAFVGGGEAG